MSVVNTKGLTRYFTKVGTSPYDNLYWEERIAHVGDFRQEGVWFPSSWSQRATDITASKYFRMVDGQRECDLRDMIGRVVNQITSWGRLDGYFEDRASCTFNAELKHILVNQLASFNSPVWFNIGVPDVAQQSSACFILNVEDTMPAILNWYAEEGMIFKGGSGAGVNVSKIRAKGAPMSNGGTASGPLSFMRVADQSAGAIKSGGGTRRAAKMVVMDGDHPDILDFIWCKVIEEEKARALKAAGFEGNAIESAQVDFQNANHSVVFSDEAMRNSPTLLREVAAAAHECGDPGVQFGDTINSWHTVPNSGRINSSNPCSEFFFLDNSACNLASINLLPFLKEDNTLDVPAFKHTVDILITAMDILVDRSSYPTAKIAQNSRDFRPLGLGYSNLGATLMAQGLPYDSDEGRTFAANITSLMTAEAYLQSTRLAEQLGHFKGYTRNHDEFWHVLERHYDASSWCDARDVWSDVLMQTGLYGVVGARNAQVTLLAPTGTISFMMDCETTGVEPLIGITQKKKMVGGGEITMVSSVAGQAISQGYADDAIFQTALGDNPLPWQAHIKMVAAVQPHLSGGVSKTINMPSDSTVEDVKAAYRMAWEMGLKSIAVYRDGCKTAQPVTVGDNVPKEERVAIRHRLPDERPSITHKFDISGHEGYMTVGLFADGSPGELWLCMAKEGSTLGGLCDAFGTAISLGLQYGVPLAALVEKFSLSRFEPAGFTNNPDIPTAQSIVDYVFRWLGKKFLGTQVAVVEEQRTLNPLRRTNGHAPICPECGNLMQTTGTCSACPACGTSGGCA